jgi:hypothetical protein
LRQILCVFLALALFILCGCEAIPGIGTGSSTIKVDEVKRIVITNGRTGNEFTVEDRDNIRSIVNQYNNIPQENGADPWKGWHYYLRIQDAQGNLIQDFTIVNKSSVTIGNKTYSMNASSLLGKIEAMECDTMTDEELLRTLFEGSYFDDITILNENGEVSLDKILSIKNDCPALFELLSRPSAIQSLGSYGMDMLNEYLNSEDSEIRQKAEEIAEILKSIFPNLKDKIEDLLSK